VRERARTNHRAPGYQRRERPSRARQIKEEGRRRPVAWRSGARQSGRTVRGPPKSRRTRRGRPFHSSHSDRAADPLRCDQLSTGADALDSGGVAAVGQPSGNEASRCLPPVSSLGSVSHRARVRAAYARVRHLPPFCLLRSRFRRTRTVVVSMRRRESRSWHGSPARGKRDAGRNVGNGVIVDLRRFSDLVVDPHSRRAEPAASSLAK